MISAVTFLLFVPFIIFYMVVNAYKRPKNFPPGPPRLPIYGAYWIILANCWDNLATAFNKLGHKYNTNILGMHLAHIPTVVINDSKLIKEMLNREEFDGRMDIILGRLRSNWKKLGIFFVDGYYWHVQRRFSLRYLRDFGFGRRDETLETAVENDIKEMLDLGLSGPKFDFEKEIVKGDLAYMPYFFSVPFMNGVIQALVRSTVPRADYKSVWEIAKGAVLFQRSSDDIGRALSLTPILKDIAPNWSGYNDLRKGNQFFLDFFGKLINEALASHDDSHDRHFIDMYIRQMKEEVRNKGKTTFSVDQLILLCTDYMFPAASAVQFVLSMLVERMLIEPEIQDKIHQEIDSVVGRDRLPTLDDRRNMPYTEASIREMMRFDTLVPLGLPHRTMRPTTLAGYDIPEDTFVCANYINLHHDKALWGDPENFRPERFIENGELKVSKDKSLPFGAGRRLCAGETYARQSMFQVFAGFMQTFHVSTADGKRLTKTSPRLPGIITTIPEFWVKITPRK